MTSQYSTDHSSSSSSSCSPPWEVLVLVSEYLEPKTLAMASCVCKSWSVSMSSNHLWKPICTSHFPSLSNHLPLSLPYRRLYAVAHAASLRRRQAPPKPRLALSDLIFTLNITSSCSNNVIVSAVKPVEELSADPGGVFKFDIVAVDYDYEHAAEGSAAEEVKVAWNVVLKGWRGIFTMMDCDGKMSFSPCAEGWLSAELPPPGCYAGTAGSGIVADFKLLFGGRRESNDRIVRVEKVSVGILSVVNWRYVTVEDALRYVQHFLLPII
ncbi:hypothetical protein L484_015511 [Morus notabilis]|uniref:F-box protein n=1 Tax=Morus notabilis TaxID=981085 RepID=W9RIU5_9ROSA|nr:probable F-box protein At5g04010 [Morus notabilis]EXB93965.1 hypothetical protein L484_015511 [Morus notabilis]